MQTQNRCVGKKTHTHTLFFTGNFVSHNFVTHFGPHTHTTLSSTFIVPGRRGIYGTGLGLVARLGVRDAAALCVGVVELGDIQFVLRGRRGAC